MARSTIEVAHFRYLVFERRGSFIPNRRNANLDFENNFFVASGHGIFRRYPIRVLLKSAFGWGKELLK